jgi:hypothetical protein
MTSKEQNITSKQAAAQHDRSDDFVMPLTPPPVIPRREILHPTNVECNENNSPNPSNVDTKDSLLSHSVESSGQDLNTDSQIQKSLAEPNLTNTVPAEAIQKPSLQIDHKKNENDTSWSSIGLSISMVIIFVLIIIIASNQDKAAPTQINDVSIRDDQTEKELATAHKEIEMLRVTLAENEKKSQLQEKRRDSELESSTTEIRDLSRKLQASERESRELLAEIEKMKSSASSTSTPPEKSATPSLQNLSSVTAPTPTTPTGKSLRVTGIELGDVLNMRSGPGVQYSVILALANEARVKVTGAGVANGSDFWLPCSFTGVFKDPVTGVARSVRYDGWINSLFLADTPP